MSSVETESDLFLGNNSKRRIQNIMHATSGLFSFWKDRSLHPRNRLQVRKEAEPWLHRLKERNHASVLSTTDSSRTPSEVC